MIELLMLGAGLGVVGGLIPSPLHLIALTQVALGKWGRAVVILTGPPLIIDGALLLVTAFCYQLVPPGIAHYVGYVGGVVLLAFACLSLAARHGKSDEEVAASHKVTYAAISAAALSELAAPGTWVYWLTIAGPIIAEGKRTGYLRIAPFFVGGLVSYYGAAILSVWVISLGVRLHKSLSRHLYVAANVLLLGLGIFYLVHAYFGGE
jgi:threonine/homoserine/homoserine lactone efflux protein